MKSVFRGGNRLKPSTQVSSWVSRYPNFTPNQINDLTLWLDASDDSTIVSSGGLVSQWSDKSPSGWNVTQSTDANKPTTGSFSQNGKNTLSFDGNDHLARTASGFPTTGERSLFTVARYTGSAGAYQHIAYYGNTTSTTNRSWGLTTWWSGSQYFGRIHIWASAQSSLSAQALQTNRFHQMSATYDGINASTIWANRIQGQKNNLVLDTLVDGEFRVGARTFTLAEYWLGQIAEIIFYNRNLTTQERTLVEDYLINKWGIDP